MVREDEWLDLLQCQQQIFLHLKKYIFQFLKPDSNVVVNTIVYAFLNSENVIKNVFTKTLESVKKKVFSLYLVFKVLYMRIMSGKLCFSHCLDSICCYLMLFKFRVPTLEKKTVSSMRHSSCLQWLWPCSDQILMSSVLPFCFINHVSGIFCSPIFCVGYICEDFDHFTFFCSIVVYVF